MENNNDANVASSTTEQVLDAAGATQTDNTEKTHQEANDSQVEKTENSGKMPPLNEHPRFKEVIAEKNKWQQKFEELQASLKKTDTNESKLDFSDEGEALYATFKDRLIKELSAEAEAKQKAAEQKEAQIQETVENFKKNFDGGVIPESFREFAQERIKVYKNATLDELYADWKATNPDVDKVAGSSSTGGQSAVKAAINHNEDFVTAAKRAMMGK